MQAGGIRWAQTPRRMLQLAFNSTAALGVHRNPACTFKFMAFQFVVLDEYFRHYPHTAKDWAETLPTQQAIEALCKDKSRFAGLLPVWIVVPGVDVSQMMFFPQVEDDPRQNESLSKWGTKQAVLADFIQFLKGSINLGYPLHEVEGAHEAIMLPGHYVRNNGVWTWQAYFTKWSEYQRGTHRALDATIDRLWLGCPPDELMLFFSMTG